MITEIIKIIEGRLGKHPHKVLSYARLLAENLAKKDPKAADRILRSIQNRQAQPVFMDQILTVPVDQETRMNIVDFIIPYDDDIEITVSETLRAKIDNFIVRAQRKTDLQAAGVNPQSSLLLYGPPGCGKTTLAHHIAQNMKLPLVVARLDSLVSSLLGNTAKNIRKVFEFASRQPCVLFLDEFDAIAKARDDQHELGELKRVVNSLIQNIDEYLETNILIAATNHQELLDKAIWRRFNSIIEIPLPNDSEIQNLIVTFLPIDRLCFDFDRKKRETLGHLLRGASPADIKSICQNAIAQSILTNNNCLSFEEILIQVYNFKYHNSDSIESLMTFLNLNGISQAAIAELLNISLRQVRNHFNEKF